jgi:hypothetical protein
MKKVFTLMVAAALVFAGCSKDDDNSDDNNTGKSDVYIAEEESSGTGGVSGIAHCVFPLLFSGFPFSVG